jgi:cob(I)alamin adenosyltransferase
LDPRKVLEFLDRISGDTDVVLTGRFATKELLDRADFVNEIKDVKSPKTIVTREGIQY